MTKERDKPEVILRGTVRFTNIIFSRGAFLICSATTHNESDPKKHNIQVTCKGAFGPIELNCLYDIDITGKENKEWNGKKKWEFTVETAIQRETQDHVGIVQLLVRGAPGLGNVLARKVVNRLGADKCLEIMQSGADKIRSLVPELNTSQAEELHKWASLQKKTGKLRAWLYGIGLTPAIATKIIQHFGEDAPVRIKTECYDLTKLPGVGFLTADNIALKLQFAKTDPRRIRAGILHAISAACSDEGSVCMDAADLCAASKKLLQVSQDLIEKEIGYLTEKKLLCTENDNPEDFIHHRVTVERMDSTSDDDRARKVAPEDAGTAEEPELS